MTLNDPPRAFAAALATLLLAAALAGCNTDSVGAPRPVTQAAPKPMTHTEAAKECWMSTEHGRNDLPLDQRADIVDKCIKNKMSAANKPTAQAKTTPAPTPKLSPSPLQSKS
jgi:hypothetical protein